MNTLASYIYYDSLLLIDLAGWSFIWDYEELPMNTLLVLYFVS